MRYEALVRLGPLVTPKALDLVSSGAEPADRYYDRGALKLLPHGAPLVIDHDLDRPIGRVNALLELQDVDDLWVWASAMVTDKPTWLERGTACSFGHFNVHVARLGWIHRAYVQEVSVLQELEPVEPRAKVVLLERTAPAPVATATPARRAIPEHAGEIFYGGGTIVRPGAGRVLGVR